ncbi:ABC transporter permease [Streptomyces sp. NPDC088816]|uniref:ABC transporter permease n=1 Tax=unclassified Streptomyces TaxID=2593676 RepID=UPI0038259AA3
MPAGCSESEPTRNTQRGPRLIRVLRELVTLVVRLWVLVTATFLMLHLVPGDPARAALGPTAPPELVAERTRALGLDRPLLMQYWDYITGVFRGDMGRSLLTGQPVVDTLREELPATLQIAGAAFVVTMGIAVPLGIVMAVFTRNGRRRALETSFTSLSVVLLAVPSFLLAQGLVYVFAIRLGWFPISGMDGPESFVLPVISLSAAPALFFARMVRAEVVSVLDAEFVRTARARRLPSWRILAFDVLPNGLTTTLTLGGLLLTGMVASTVFVEQVFSWPGLGSTLVSSIQGKDFSVVQGIVLIYGAAVLVVNFLVDVALEALDPRPAESRS